MYLHFYVLGVSAACMLLGFYFRLASFVFAVGFTYVFLIDQCWYQNHYYLVCLLSLLCIFLPAQRALSLDAWRRPTLRSDIAPRWSLHLLRVQIGIPYFFGGLAKINGDWLHGQPMGIWLTSQSEFPRIGRFLTQAWCAYLFSYGGMLFDLLVVPLLLWRRSRWITLLVVIGFHLLNASLFNIGYFPWLMLLATALVFVPPEQIAKLRLWRRNKTVADEATDADQRLAAWQRWSVAALTLYAIVQTVVPLRYLLYPGNPAWTSEASYFAWRMKLHNQRFHISFRAVNPVTGKSSTEDGRYLLTRVQEYKLTHPDMILQLCHALSRDLTSDPERPVEIYVDAKLALNDRPLLTFIDSNVNLAAECRTLGHAQWIVPLEVAESKNVHPPSPPQPPRRRAGRPAPIGIFEDVHVGRSL